jgi:hypothetical protein
MKKQLLLGSILLTTLYSFSQSGQVKPQSSSKPVNMTDRLFQREIGINRPVEKAPVFNNNNSVVPPIAHRSSSPPVGITWNYLSGSINIFGVLESDQKPLHYNDELNVVSFIHRKSATYVPSPVPTTTGAISGVIVGAFTENWGQTFDSTAIWNNANYWARYPQGGIYSAPGNTNIANAHIIASGPIVTAAQSWMGGFLASKQIDTVGANMNDSIVSSVSGATVFASNTAPYIDGYKFDSPRFDYTATDDGKVRMMGTIVKDANGTTNPAYGFRGGRIIIGDYNNNGAFDWSTDSIIPSARYHSTGYYMMNGRPRMCWDEAGVVGYVWFIGCTGDTNAALPNRGYQPMVWKTTNSGSSWSQIVSIDFTDTLKYNAPVLNRILNVSGSTVAIPYFHSGEGQDASVDKFGNLHIVTTLLGTYSSHPDSLGYLSIPNAATSSDGEEYLFGHRDFLRPYIYDFTYTDHKGWRVAILDSMSSEGPGTRSTENGYADNPWNGTGNQDKVETNARIQLSRSTDGKYMVVTWSESDTLFTNGQHKWNQLPNVKARLIKINPDSSITVHANEINVTNPPSNADTRIAGRATMHYAATKCAVISTTNTSGVAIGLPITISNTQGTPMNHNGPCEHWYTSATLNFDNVAASNIKWPVSPRVVPTATVDAISESGMGAASRIYPNPASGNAVLSLDMSRSANVEVSIMNTMGQVVRTTKVSTQQGVNTINLNIHGLPVGIYMVNIKSGSDAATKKLVIQ